MQFELGFDKLLPKGVTAQKTRFTLKELKKFKAGQPMAGSGSRGGKGILTARPSRAKASQRQDEESDGKPFYFAVGGASAEGEGIDDITKGDGQPGQEAIEVGDVDDATHATKEGSGSPPEQTDPSR